jgi:hypothetical protein
MTQFTYDFESRCVFCLFTFSSFLWIIYLRHANIHCLKLHGMLHDHSLAICRDTYYPICVLILMPHISLYLVLQSFSWLNIVLLPFQIELKTAPVDFRFPTTNQTRHCFTRYIEFHRWISWLLAICSAKWVF